MTIFDNYLTNIHYYSYKYSANAIIKVNKVPGCDSGHGISLLGGVKLDTAFDAGNEWGLFFHYVPSPVGLSIPASQTGQRREF